MKTDKVAGYIVTIKLLSELKSSYRSSKAPVEAKMLLSELTFFSKKIIGFVFLLEEAETWVGAAVTVNVMGEVAVIIPTISPNEGR